MAHLSVIIPAYNEEIRLPSTLECLANYALSTPYSMEILVVDNASRDSTHLVALSYAQKCQYIRVIQEPQKGKGYAIRAGMLNAKGDYRLIFDADLSMPTDEIDKFLPPNSNSDVSIGSRFLPSSKIFGEPISRLLLSRAFNFMIQSLLLPGINDSQCGYKCFSGDAAKDIFCDLSVGGWAFDVEALVLAKKKGFTIAEVPINWHFKEGSKVNPIIDSISMFFDVIRIWARGKG
jgi:glycosyltransferase involved in cell wall biosynthesis